MKNKSLIVGVVVMVAIVTGVIFLMKAPAPKKKSIAAVAAPAVAAARQPAAKATVKKIVISKGMGALTVKIMGPKQRELSLRIRAFKNVDSRSAVYVATFFTGRAQELPPGAYDLEIETIPQMIYKNVNVAKERETVEDLGRITGSINIKVLNAKNKAAYYPVRVLHAGTDTVVATITTNRPAELAKGVYDLEIGTLPKQFQKNIAVGEGKDLALDLGPIIGSIAVISVDGEKKEVRYPTRIRKAGTGDIVTSSMSNRSVELVQGEYDVEILSNPTQVKKGVKVEAGKEAGAEFLVQTSPKPQAAPPAQPKAQAAKPLAQAPAAKAEAPVQTAKTEAPAASAVKK